MKPDLYLINGPLGAGKTTLLKYLLSTPKFAAARVVENEFSSQSVDTEQLAHHHGEVKTIAGLCICCSTGSELTDALEELATTSNEPVIIEATGVANSLLLVEKLAAAGLLERYNLRQGLFVLDAAEVAMRPELIEEYHEELAAADVVLLQKDLGVLEQGILEGRKTFTNMLKYIKITAGSNFGNIFSIVCASAFLPFLPMTSLQILLLNLLYDVLCSASNIVLIFFKKS